MFYLEPPADFAPAGLAVSSYLLHDGKFVMLKREAHKSEGGKWGIPGGKVNEGEEPAAALVREIREETGVNLPPSAFRLFRKAYLRYPDRDWEYWMYQTELPEQPLIRINPAEHLESRWVNQEEALALDLMFHDDDCIRLFFGAQSRV